MPLPQLLLDQLPVEIIFKIFDFFNAVELRHSLYSVSRYLRQCVRSYPRFNAHCQGIHKDDFDWICQTILPEQITALTLSNDDETPGQLDLFFARFPAFEQSFTRLRQLQMRNLDTFPDWPQLTSLHTLTVHFKRWPIYSFDYERVKQCDQAVINMFRLPALRNLTLFNEPLTIDFNYQLLPVAQHLQRFDVHLRAVDHLPTIFQRTPHLQRLSLRLQTRTLSNGFVSNVRAPPSLTHLSLSVSYGLQAELVEVLRMCPTLTHLNICIERQQSDLQQWFDSDWWRALLDHHLPKLMALQLHIGLPLSSDSLAMMPMIQNFRTAFHTTAEQRNGQFTLRVTPVDEWLTSPVRETVLANFPTNETIILPPGGFSNVQTLHLMDETNSDKLYIVSDLSQLRPYVHDFSTLTHLKFTGACIISPTLFNELFNLAPRLTRLTLNSRHDHLLPMLQCTYPQVRWLDLRREYVTSKARTKFCATFPCLQHILNCRVYSEEDLEVLLENLPYLQSITVHIKTYYFDTDEEFDQWLRGHSRLTNFTFTLIDKREVQLWIHNRRQPTPQLVQ